MVVQMVYICILMLARIYISNIINDNLGNNDNQISSDLNNLQTILIKNKLNIIGLFIFIISIIYYFKNEK